MRAEVIRGHLEYSDERGSYRIPVGRRSRKCLAVLDSREGEYTRSLEIDLFTGYVYYSVDNATSGGLSYYYDMTSKKVGHYFIHRYLRTAINHGFSASPQEMEIFEKLPCSNWEEELEKLPGWKEAIENRVQNLLLPGRDVVRIPMDDFPPQGAGTEPSVSSAGEITAISFFVSPAAYPAGKREQVYWFEKAEESGTRILRFRNDVFGDEFFGENGEYEFYLTEKEYWWICKMAENILNSGGAAFGENEVSEKLSALRKDQEKEEMVLQEALIHSADQDAEKAAFGTPSDGKRARELRTILYGLLRREVELI